MTRPEESTTTTVTDEEAALFAWALDIAPEPTQTLVYVLVSLVGAAVTSLEESGVNPNIHSVWAERDEEFREQLMDSVYAHAVELAATAMRKKKDGQEADSPDA